MAVTDLQVSIPPVGGHLHGHRQYDAVPSTHSQTRKVEINCDGSLCTEYLPARIGRVGSTEGPSLIFTTLSSTSSLSLPSSILFLSAAALRLIFSFLSYSHCFAQYSSLSKSKKNVLSQLHQAGWLAGRVVLWPGRDSTQQEA